MDQESVAQFMTRLSGMWPYFSQTATPDQVKAMARVASKIDVNTEEALSALDLAYTKSEKGWPPFPHIWTEMNRLAKQKAPAYINGKPANSVSVECIKLIGQLWPSFNEESNDAQRYETMSVIERAQITLEQAQAIIKSKWRAKAGGYAPLEQIIQTIEEVDRAERYSRSSGGYGNNEDKPDPIEWHTQQLTDGFRRHGYAYPFVNEEYDAWFQRAADLGLDVYEIAGLAMGINADQVEREIRARYKHRSESASRWEQLMKSRRLSKSQVLEGKGVLPEAAL